MLLSASSSRAVSMRRGTSDLWRMRRQISMPSMSGSIRSSTIREGCSLWAEASASVPFDAVRTSYPAFFRYRETNDAIEASSSTTSTNCVLLLMAMSLRTGSRQGEYELEARNRTVVAAVDRIASVVRCTCAGQRDVPLADEREIDAPSLHHDPERPADDPETNPGAAPRGRGVVALDRRKVVARDDRSGAVAVDRVADRHRAPDEAADHPAARRNDDLPLAVLD